MVRNYAQDKRNRLAKAAQQHSAPLDSHFIRPKKVANQAAPGEGTEAKVVENNAQDAFLSCIAEVTWGS